MIFFLFFIFFFSIPKLIIYAKNIKINCEVTKIDAVLIADDNIDTCADIEDVNAEGRSKQLTIFGTVITDTLDLKRTYGAATGTNSAVPAEIINYDTSLYLWANQNAGLTKSGRITSTYQRELPPRY